MPCVTPLRLAIGLAGCPEADQPALAAEAERVRLDFVTTAATAGPGVVAGVLAAAPRIGVLTGYPDDDRRLVQAGAGASDTASDTADDTAVAGAVVDAVVGIVVGDRTDLRFAAEHADIAFVTPADPASTPDLVDDLRAARAASGRADHRLLVFADVRLADLPADAASGLASLLQAWQRRGLDGFRVIVTDAAEVHALTRGVIPALLENDAFRRGYDSRTLRGVLGLPAVIPAAAP